MTQDADQQAVLNHMWLEEAAGKRLAEAMADLGAALLPIFERGAAGGLKSFLADLEPLARDRRLTPLSLETAMLRIKAEQFRRLLAARYGDKTPALSDSQVYPILTLEEAEIADFVTHGVPLPDGSRSEIGLASSREIKAAAAAVRARNGRSGSRTKTRADRVRQILDLIDGLGDLTDSELEAFAAATGLLVPQPAQEPAEPRSAPDAAVTTPMQAVLQGLEAIPALNPVKSALRGVIPAMGDAPRSVPAA